MKDKSEYMLYVLQAVEDLGWCRKQKTIEREMRMKAWVKIYGQINDLQ